jgi:hypothetical protein
VRLLAFGSVNRSRSREFIAIPLVFFLLGAIFLVLAAAAVGVWAWILAGILILFGIVYGLFALRRSRLLSAGDVPDVPSRRDPTTYNVLVVAEDRCPPDALRRIVEDHAAGRTVTAYVVAPAVGSTLDRITGDQTAYNRASEHLESALGSLEGLTAKQHGKVGSHDPLQAIEEALREFPAEEILVAAQSERTLAAEARFGVHVAALSS